MFKYANDFFYNNIKNKQLHNQKKVIKFSNFKVTNKNQKSKIKKQKVVQLKKKNFKNTNNKLNKTKTNITKTLQKQLTVAKKKSNIFQKHWLKKNKLIHNQQKK